MDKEIGFAKKLSKWVTVSTEVVIIVMMGVMAAVTIAQVFMRYVVHSPIRWSEELARYLMAWVAFLGASLGIRAGVHIGLEAFVKSLPPESQRTISIIVKVFLIAFLAVVIKEGFTLCRALAFQCSPAMRISMFWPYFSVPTGAILMIVQILPLLLEDLQALRTHERRETDTK
ncbi:MAG: TRAP transporter small permease [Candidatus Caldatribacteriaceae bacterium]